MVMIQEYKLEGTPPPRFSLQKLAYFSVKWPLLDSLTLAPGVGLAAHFV